MKVPHLILLLLHSGLLVNGANSTTSADAADAADAASITTLSLASTTAESTSSTWTDSTTGAVQISSTTTTPTTNSPNATLTNVTKKEHTDGSTTSSVTASSSIRTTTTATTSTKPASNKPDSTTEVTITNTTDANATDMWTTTMNETTLSPTASLPPASKTTPDTSSKTKPVVKPISTAATTSSTATTATATTTTTTTTATTATTGTSSSTSSSSTSSTITSTSKVTPAVTENTISTITNIPKTSPTTSGNTTSTTSASTTRSTAGSPALPTTNLPPLLQAIFYGSAHNWTTPRVNLCLYCSNKKRPNSSTCYSVKDIQMGNHTSTGQSYYTWEADMFYASVCKNLSFFWTAQWPVGDDDWGYIDNGAVIKGWQTTDVQHFSGTSHGCSSRALQIVTEWSNKDIINMTCVSKFFKTSKLPFVSVSGAAVNPDSLRNITIPKVVFDTSTSTKTSTPPPKHVQLVNKYIFGTGPIVAIVVCSCIVILVVVVATICAVKSVGRKRRQLLINNFDDHDESSIAFDNLVTNRTYSHNVTDSRSLLYSPLGEDDEDEYTVYQPKMYTNKDVEEVSHRSGGGVTTVYEDGLTMSSIPSNNNHNKRKPILQRKSSSVQNSPLNESTEN